MRKIFVLTTILVSVAGAVNAQCDTKTKFTASKTEFIRQSGGNQHKGGTGGINRRYAEC